MIQLTETSAQAKSTENNKLLTNIFPRKKFEIQLSGIFFLTRLFIIEKSLHVGYNFVLETRLAL